MWDKDDQHLGCFALLVAACSSTHRRPRQGAPVGPGTRGVGGPRLGEFCCRGDSQQDLEASAGGTVLFPSPSTGSDITPEAQQILARQADWAAAAIQMSRSRSKDHCGRTRPTREVQTSPLGERRAQGAKKRSRLQWAFPAARNLYDQFTAKGAPLRSSGRARRPTRRKPERAVYHGETDLARETEHFRGSWTGQRLDTLGFQPNRLRRGAPLFLP